jgi:hypothetical protein
VGLRAKVLARNNLLMEVNNELQTQYRVHEDLRKEQQQQYKATREEAQKKTTAADGQMWMVVGLQSNPKIVRDRRREWKTRTGEEMPRMSRVERLADMEKKVAAVPATSKTSEKLRKHAQKAEEIRGGRG